MYECNAIEKKKHTHTHSSVAEKVIQTLQDPLLTYTIRSTLSHTHEHTHTQITDYLSLLVHEWASDQQRGAGSELQTIIPCTKAVTAETREPSPEGKDGENTGRRNGARDKPRLR